MQFLLVDGPDGIDIDENVKVAIAYAAFNWAAGEATAPRRSTPKTINGILGRGSKTRVSPNAYGLLSLAGTYQHNLVDSLGANIVQALGLKAKANAPQDLEAKLRVALGSHALKLLEDAGMAKRTTLSGAQIKELREEGLNKFQLKKLGKTNVDASHYFFAVTRDEQGVLDAGVNRIFEATRGTKDILGKLFGVASGSTIPSLEAIKETQATTKGTKMGVPKELKKIIEANQARPRQVRKDTMGLFAGFTDNQLHTMMGVSEEEMVIISHSL